MHTKIAQEQLFFPSIGHAIFYAGDIFCIRDYLLFELLNMTFRVFVSEVLRSNLARDVRKPEIRSIGADLIFHVSNNRGIQTLNLPFPRALPVCRVGSTATSRKTPRIGQRLCVKF